VRVASKAATNMGDTADVVVALNEQVLYSRIDVGGLREGTLIFLEAKWADSEQPEIREAYASALEDFRSRGYEVCEVPMETECLRIVEDARRGKNMWILGLLAGVYERDLAKVEYEVERKFLKKGETVLRKNLDLVRAGHDWARANLPIRFRLAFEASETTKVVMNGNQALALGIMASGIEVCSMYPITPATSVSHYLAGSFPKVGGFLHQAEDEIAAIGFALGASYGGKTPVTVTSGPGLALKTEFIALAVMAELPLVLINVQRGGPSTGLPTRVEQGGLLASLYASPGDAPKIVMAASTIEECFHFVITARQLAETFRGPVVLLTDANLATGQQPFERPVARDEWLAPPVDQSDWDPEVPPYCWDEETGLSSRPVPGQRGGNYVLTGLAHDEAGTIAYESAINEHAMSMRSRKLAALQRTLRPPEINGDQEGELLVVGWGSTRGCIEEAVERVRADGGSVSSLNLRFLSPLEPGLKEIFSRFRQVMTVEINYSDDPDSPLVHDENRRRAQLARHLRSETLVDVDCWSSVPGVPLPPESVERELRRRLGMDR
jgi:2-oxoglutarate ferredoxin oxidoreductase subunit alpha